MTVNKLRCVQNRAVCRHGGQADAQLLLKSLQWLLVNEHITYKVAVLTYRLRSSSTQLYLSTLLQPVISSCSLISVGSLWLQVQRTLTEFGRRAFSIVARKVWNALPNKLRLSSALPTFKKHKVAIIQYRIHVTVSPQQLCIFTTSLHYINPIILLLMMPTSLTAAMYGENNKLNHKV